MEIPIFLAIILAVIGVFAIVFAYSVLAWSLVILKGWNWFLVTFFTLSPITFVQAVAINLVITIVAVRCISPRSEDMKAWSNKDENKEQNIQKISYFILAPWVTLLFAWIVKLFIC